MINSTSFRIKLVVVVIIFPDCDSSLRHCGHRPFILWPDVYLEFYFRAGGSGGVGVMKICKYTYINAADHKISEKNVLSSYFYFGRLHVNVNNYLNKHEINIRRKIKNKLSPIRCKSYNNKNPQQRNILNIIFKM